MIFNFVGGMIMGSIGFVVLSMKENGAIPGHDFGSYPDDFSSLVWDNLGLYGIGAALTAALFYRKNRA